MNGNDTVIDIHGFLIISDCRSFHLPREGGCAGDEEHGGGRVCVWREENKCGGEPQYHHCLI